MSGRKVVVTGAAGFIGRCLVEEILGRGDRVVAVLRRGGTRLPPELEKRVEVMEADLAQEAPDPARWRSAETIFHLAGFYQPGCTKELFAKLWRLNVDATRHVVEAARQAGVRRFIHFSSVAVCEESDHQVVNEEAGTPSSAYGLSKRESERIFYTGETGSMAWTIFRPVAVFGEGRSGPIWQIADRVRRGRFAIFGDGTNRMSFIHRGDLVAAVLFAERIEATHGKIYILADEPVRLAALVDLVCSVFASCRRPPCFPLWLGQSVAALGSIIEDLTGWRMPLNAERFRTLVRDRVYSGEKFLRETGFKFSTGIQKRIGNRIFAMTRRETP